MGKKRSAAGQAVQAIGHWLAYAVYRAVEQVILAMPLERVWRLGYFLGRVAWLMAGRYRRLALHNLRIAFGGEKSEAERLRLAREHFSLLGANLLSGVKLAALSREEIESRITLEGFENRDRVLPTGRPMVYILSHLSCWEVLTQTPSLFAFGRKLATIYQPLRNPWLNRHILRRRERLGCAGFDRQAGFSGPIKHLREGGVIGVLVDQHAGDHGTWCPLFDRLASTTSVVALMAQRTGAAVLSLGVYSNGPGRWRMVCDAVTDRATASVSSDELTAVMNGFVEAMVRRQPEDWFWVHNRWKTPNPRFLLQTYKRGIAFPPGHDPARLQRFELLVRSPNWLGDACMTLPAIRAMKAGRPDLRLTVFGPEKLRDLWEAQPEVARYIGKPAKEGPLAVARRIKATGTQFDAAVLLTNSTRSTLELWLAGIPRLVGFRGSLRSRLLHQRIKEPPAGGPPPHHTDRYLHIAHSCGATLGESVNELPAPAAAPSSGSYRVGICAGAEYGPAKRWPLDRFAAVIAAVGATHPEIEWVFFGAPGEAAMGEELARMVGTIRHLNLVGKTSLAELIAKLKTCACLLTNDTGTMHLAAAHGVRTVAIFGSTEPALTGPRGREDRILRHHVPCSPCFERKCPFGHYECMTGVTPEAVAAELESVIATSAFATSE